MENKKEYFTITSVSRDDLKEIGIPKKIRDKITDSEMEGLAKKMANSYMDCCFWIALKDFYEMYLKV